MKYKAENEQKGAGILLLTLITAAGIITGALYSLKGDFAECPLLHQYVMPYSDVRYTVMFAHTTVSSLIFLAAVFFAGFSAIGQPVAVLLLLYRSFGAGLAAAVMYGIYGIKAVPSVIILMFPKAAVLLLTAVIAVRESVRSSCGIIRCFLFGESTDNGGLKLYIVRFTVLAFISVLVSAGDAVLNYFFGGLIGI